MFPIYQPDDIFKIIYIFKQNPQNEDERWRLKMGERTWRAFVCDEEETTTLWFLSRNSNLRGFCKSIIKES